MKHAQSRIRNQEIARKGADGCAVSVLSEEYDLSPQYIYCLFRKHGVTRQAAESSDRRAGPKAAQMAKRRAAIVELHSLGVSGGQAIRLTGLHKVTFYSEARHLGLKFPYDTSRRSVGGLNGKQRAAKMAAMYRAGMTLQQIGETFSISRERVRQLMTKHEGMSRESGGQHRQAIAKRQHSDARKDAKCLEKHGCTYAQYVEIRDHGRAMRRDGKGVYQTPLRAFTNQRNNAIRRGIGWSLTLWQWWTLWQQSGKWQQRGKRRDAYVMSRFRDQGDYVVGNVYIGTLSENSSIQPNNRYRKDHPEHEAFIAQRREVSSAHKSREAA